MSLSLRTQSKNTMILKTLKTIFLFILVISSSISYSQTSVLSSGNIYKIEIKETGIYKLDYDFLSKLDGFNINDINPKKIAIYGNGGGMLPQINSEYRIEDLEETSIYISGESDNKFNNNDYILFYAEGPNNIRYNSSTNTYYSENNVYDNSNFYFLKVIDTNAKRISTKNNISNPSYTFQTTERFQNHDKDKTNLLGNAFKEHGSGREWYGEYFFSNIREHNLTDEFSFDNIDLSKLIEVKMTFAAKSLKSSKMEIYFDSKKLSQSVNATVSANYSTYAIKSTLDKSLLLENNDPEIVLKYPKNGVTNEAWLDDLNILSHHYIKYNNTPLIINNSESRNYNSAKFSINNYQSSLFLWNITNPLQPTKQSVDNNTVSFETYGKNQKFYLFDIIDTKTPHATTRIENQNIHDLSATNMLIIYHQNFKEQAERLAQYRRTHSKIDVTLVDIESVYNEFSSGKCDPTAIRDFTRYMKHKFQNLKYLLLFGDGSYDYRGISPIEKQNFIPVYETISSLNPTSAFPSDDYYALLDDHEGADNLKGGLDIAIGRLPVNTEDQAQIVVDKIIRYESDPNSLGDWRLNISFCADDEDNANHLTQAESIANTVANNNHVFNQDKIYFDAYKQKSTPGGDRFPEATKAINNNMFKGQLLMTYLGHGGPTGWAQERVLQINDIESWKNKNKLTLMITATCSFAGYDDANITTAGENVLLNKLGGAVALYTTSRPVNGSGNRRLTQAVYDHMFTREDGDFLGIGEILRLGKNSNSSDTTNYNARKFVLLGDPSMKLAIPKHKIITTHINGKDVQSSETLDTIRALSKVKVAGIITDFNNKILSDFNGEITSTIFDKSSILSTLGNDSDSSIKQFNLQQNVLFKGTASITNGHWEYEFQMPKDIKFNYGKGKISHYASDKISQDAMGSYGNIIIGGNDTTSIKDTIGPEISIFMNDENFGWGGYTNDRPILLLNLSDISGINITGNSVGHDISGVIDGDITNTIIMNQYYKATTDDYKSGKVRFPLTGLSTGVHTIKIKAWDIVNNPSEKELEFNVIDPTDTKLHHVMNYPNPFVSNTNFRFEHGLANTPLDITIHIFTVTGKLIRTIEDQRNGIEQSVVDIPWDGTDGYNEKIGKGIYFYKIKVKAKELGISKESGFEKIAKLK